MYLTGGQDYQIPNNQYIKVKFPAGETRASFDINIINDDFLEEPETFRITIFELSVPYGITLGSITSAIVTILDDDSKFTETIQLNSIHLMKNYNDLHQLAFLCKICCWCIPGFLKLLLSICICM